MRLTEASCQGTLRMASALSAALCGRLQNRLYLFSVKRRLNRLRQQLQFCNHGIGLTLIIILAKRHKINVFHIHQHPDIFKTRSQRIIC